MSSRIKTEIENEISICETAIEEFKSKIDKNHFISAFEWNAENLIYSVFKLEYLNEIREITQTTEYISTLKLKLENEILDYKSFAPNSTCSFRNANNILKAKAQCDIIRLCGFIKILEEKLPGDGDNV